MEPKPSPILIINLLGTFDVRRTHANAPDSGAERTDEPVQGWRSEKTKWLLAYLLLHPGEATMAHLERTLWPDTATTGVGATYDNTRQSLANLYKLLGHARFLKPSRSSVRLDLAGLRSDVLAFDAAIRDASTEGIPALQRAVALYRGPLLPGCNEDWIAPYRENRRQHYARALHELTVDATAGGDYDTAENYLRLEVASDPRKEGPRCTLMRLLVRRREYNSALDVYRDLRAALQNDPKARPGPDITELYQEITVLSRQGSEPTSACAHPAIVSAVPSPLNPLVGREQALREVGARLLLNRLVTLTGAPGVGKTQLALHAVQEVAGEFRAGVAFVDLAEESPARTVSRRLGSALEVRREPNETEEEALVRRLLAGSLLLVLDNCDTLLGDCVRLVGRLLRECPRLHVLATSRHVLGLTGESVCTVSPLAVPDAALLDQPASALTTLLPHFSAVQLFLQRTKDAGVTFALTPANARDVAALCLHLEGLPLALEMAAAWATTLTAEQMVAHLARPLEFLVDSGRSTSARNGSLWAALEGSVALLTPPQQRLLAQLAVFCGGWTQDAAAPVCDVPASWQEVRALQQRSLVSATDAGGQRRFRLLEPLRALARARLTRLEDASLTRRHAAYFLQAALTAEPHLKGREQAAWIQRVEHDYGNFRAALAWASESRKPQEGLQLAGALGRFWQAQGYYEEGLHWLDRLLDLGEPTADAMRLKAVQAAGNLAFLGGDHAQAQGRFTDLLRLAETLGDRRGMASALGNLGNLASEAGDYAQARVRFDACLRVFEKMEDRRGVMLTWGNLAVVACREGDYAQACAYYEASIAQLEREGDGLNLAVALNNLADTKLTMGELTEVERILGLSLALGVSLDSKRSLLHGLSLAVGLALKRDRTQRAAVLLGAAEALRERIGVPLPAQAREEHRRQRDRMQEALGAEAFAQALAGGRALAAEEAVALALSAEETCAETEAERDA